MGWDGSRTIKFVTQGKKLKMRFFSDEKVSDFENF